MSDLLDNFHLHGASLLTREIFLHNHHSYDENPGVEYKMSTMFIKNLRALDQDSSKEITVHMQSIGGEWGDGMAIYDAIKICRSRITIISYGQAESMSSIILQAAHKRLLTRNSYVMVHYGTSGYSSQYLNAQNWHNYEKYLCDIMMDIYACKCVSAEFFKNKNYDTSKVKKYLYRKLKNGDWYMNPKQAIYHGFADGIIDKWQ
jgi:ATP-dependent Clp protease, protease subunit